MRRVAMIMALAAALATWACGASGEDERTAVSTSTTEAVRHISTTIQPGETTDKAAPAGSRRSTTTKPASTADKGAPASARPTVQVSMLAKAGETAPGRVQPLDAPAWKATGSGWREGDVTLEIRRPGEAELVAGVPGRADRSGRWEQTFVLPVPASPGTYVAVASQGRLSAEASFVFESSSAETEVVDSGRAPTGEWQLVAERQAGGLLCAVLSVDGRDQGQVCNEASEQDFNGDDVLRYSVLGDGTFVVGVSVSGVDKVRAELRDGTIVERGTVGASFAGSRFVALPLPGQSVISTLVALGDNGQVFTRFTLNP